jgi:uncharacterized cupredoxin-like copper-binding protein
MLAARIRSTHPKLLVPPMLTLALLAGACGGGGDGEPAGATVNATNGAITIEAVDTKFQAVDDGVIGTIRAAAGPLRVTLVQKGNLAHDFQIEGESGKALVPAGGSDAEASWELEPGEYAFFCGQPGHRGQGMEGKLIIA